MAFVAVIVLGGHHSTPDARECYYTLKKVSFIRLQPETVSKKIIARRGKLNASLHQIN
jgi:hypothetical protein